MFLIQHLGYILQDYTMQMSFSKFIFFMIIIIQDLVLVVFPNRKETCLCKLL